jgi:hypothetical protein
MSRRRPLLILLGFAGLEACQPSQPPSLQSPVQTSMHEHFALARDLRDWATSGDFEALRATARELAVPQETWGLPPSSDAYVLQIREAAARAAEAVSGADAIRASADVARVCGDCHVAKQSTLGERFVVARPMVEDPAVRHVNYLSWVSRLLWDGLVGPSERMWRAGAEAMAAVGGVPPPRSTAVPAAEVERTSRLLGDLARRAFDVREPMARAELVADIWTVCAECHRDAGLVR